MGKSKRKTKELVVAERPWIKIQLCELQLMFRDFAEARDNRPRLGNIGGLLIASVPAVLNTFPDEIYGFSGATLHGAYSAAVAIWFAVTLVSHLRHFLWRFLVMQDATAEFRPDRKVGQIGNIQQTKFIAKRLVGRLIKKGE